MSDWTDLLVDQRTIHAFFGDDAPSLEGVELHEIVLKSDGPTVSLRVDLPEFPLNPPAKWRDAGFNRVQIRLLAFGVKELDVRGLVTNPVLNLEIGRDAGLIRVRGASDGMVIDVLTEFLDVLSDGVSAYFVPPEA